MYASGQQSKLHILQQHELQKFAFTMCKGNFGGVKGKEFICVMFLDGSLKFFEQDGISQDCVLPGNRTIPTNFVYVPRTDCFILLAPNWDLECYRWVERQKFFSSVKKGFDKFKKPTLRLSTFFARLTLHRRAPSTKF